MIGAVVLAAGGSRRLGRPKQLVPWRGRPLVRRVARAALAAGCEPVVVVVGARAADVRATLDGLPVEIVVNPHWRRGLAGSIRAGIRRVARRGVTAAALLVCDQPRLTPAVLRRLIASHAGPPSGTAACAYAGTVGVPAIFPRSRFPELLALRGDRGAHRLLDGRTRSVRWAGGAVDVDRPDDLP